MFSTNELSDMRAAIEQLLPDTCTVYARTATNTNGVITYANAATGTDYACRLDAKTYERKMDTGAVKFYHTYVLTLPYDAVVTETDRIVHNSIEYAITSIDKDKSWPVSTRVNVEVVND